MRYNFAETVITILVFLLVSAVLWLLILFAVIHVFGCSLSLEVESEMHHHEAENLPLEMPTPTPAAR